MTVVPLCQVIYRRPDGTILTCQYLPGHPVGHHSWRTASVHDSTVPMRIVQEITEGLLDSYLEAILAAAHTRKRTLRGVI